jgi:hypothetical protein
MNHDAKNTILIAQKAAALILETGLSNWQEAKKKAAHALGLPMRDLPDDSAVQAALFERQAIFGTEKQAHILTEKRRTALRWMTVFADFSPKIYGGIAEGWAGEHQDIYLELTADDEKAVEIILINLGADYSVRQPDNPRSPALLLTVHDQTDDVHLRVAPPYRHLKHKGVMLSRDELANKLLPSRDK